MRLGFCFLIENAFLSVLYIYIPKVAICSLWTVCPCVYIRNHGFGMTFCTKSVRDELVIGTAATLKKKAKGEKSVPSLCYEQMCHHCVYIGGLSNIIFS